MLGACVRPYSSLLFGRQYPLARVAPCRSAPKRRPAGMQLLELRSSVRQNKPGAQRCVETQFSAAGGGGHTGGIVMAAAPPPAVP